MDTPRDASQRLLRLGLILAPSQSSLSARDGTEQPSDLYLDGIPFERMRQVTAELQRFGGAEVDEIDVLAMRLLLSDYCNAVTQLRAATRLVEQRVDAAAAPIEHARRTVRHQLKRAKAARQP